jgi:hypothetical protein
MEIEAIEQRAMRTIYPEPMFFSVKSPVTMNAAVSILSNTNVSTQKHAEIIIKCFHFFREIRLGSHLARIVVSKVFDRTM